MIVDLTENELKVILNELWLRLHASGTRRSESTGSYAMWLKSAHDKLYATLQPIPEFADNH